jgi:hypothetical protein
VHSEQFDVRPATLSSFFLPALGPEERIFCYADPTWQKQCEQVDRLNQAFLNGLLADAAVRFAEPGDYTCPQPGTGGLGGPARLCEGASAAEVRAGLPVAFHGSEGDVLSISQLREAIAGFLRSGAVRVATIGCPVSGDCDQRFIVGFAVDAQPAAFYLVFESRPNGVALVGAGVAGDIALEIRRGGTAFTSFGETLFTPVTPPY